MALSHIGLCRIGGCFKPHAKWSTVCAMHRTRWYRHKDYSCNLRETPKAIFSPTTADLQWAAGFMEGEGCFTNCGTHKHPTCYVSASQKELGPLTKLAGMFGGRITKYPTINRWRITGARARGVMLTLYTLMCTRRRGQIVRSLKKGRHQRWL